MPSNRLSEIDITRGLVMVLMALDHTRDFFGDHSIAGWHFFVSYPVLPWFGVMAFGYGAGGFIQKHAGFDPPIRRAFLWCGIGMTLLFVLLRIPNLLDPDPWSIQSRTGFTVLSFINTEKYPPSFLYLLMTLGPMLGFMAIASYLPKITQRTLIVLGRVPQSHSAWWLKYL